MNIQRKLPELSSESSQASKPVSLLPPAKAISTTRQLRRLHALLEQEIALLRKIRYKQKNQHKSATWWRHVTGSQRVAKRFQAEFEQSVLPALPDISNSDTKPAMDVGRFPRTVEGCLRLLLLVEAASSMNLKATAALEQLLKAALFMPLAMSMKAIIARLAGLLELFDGELRNLIGVIRETSKNNTSVGSSIDRTIRKLPADLTKFWPRGKIKNKGPIPSVLETTPTIRSDDPPIPSTSNSTMLLAKPDTVTEYAAQKRESPQAAVQTVEVVPTVPAKRRSETVHALQTKPSEGTTFSEQSQAVTEAPPPAKKAKVKKRKKAPGDDIDAIFAGL